MNPRIRALLLTSTTVLLVQGAALSAAQAQLVINEIDYDQPSTDTAEFIEIKNTGAAAVNLSGHSLRLVNGANGTIYGTLSLPAIMVPAGGYYVACANSGTVANCGPSPTPALTSIQNGDPDAVALILAGQIVDTVSYGGATTGYTEASGAGKDFDSLANHGISRCADGVDTQNNNADFRHKPITPGAANSCGGGGGAVGACGDPATSIAAIQGSGAASPMANQTVNVEAVVVGDFQDAGINGFFLQEEDGAQDGNPATSDGLFVFEGALAVPVSAGTLVRVRGLVAEFDGLTELTSVSDIVVCPGAATASAQPLVLPTGSGTTLERLEGMLVQLDQTLTVTGNYELGRFGSLDLSVGGRLFQPTQVVAPGAAALAQQDLNDRSRIILDDASTGQNPNPIPYKDGINTRRVGDTLPFLTGVIDGRLGAYRIQPTAPPVFQAGNPRPLSPPPTGGRIRVATFNVLNFFTTLDTGSPVCGPTGGLDCRGANSALEFDRQRTKILRALLALNADIVGLVEIENNASAATQSLVDGLNAVLGGGTYSFVNTGTIGTDAIKVAYIYKGAVVTPVGPHQLLTSAVDPRFLDTKNRPALAQTWQELGGTQGRLTTVVNHLKSKGSACTDVGDPDLGDGQGNCNGTRTQAAAALRDWIATDPTGSQDGDFLVMGDLNAYARENPISTLEAAGMQSVTAGQPASYSYQFQGQSGSLDTALATAGLATQITGAFQWHSNADEPVVLDYNTEFKTDDPYDGAHPFRASDHDAVVVGLDLTGTASVPAGDVWSAGTLGMLLLLLGSSLQRSRKVPAPCRP